MYGGRYHGVLGPRVFRARVHDVNVGFGAFLAGCRVSSSGGASIKNAKCTYAFGASGKS